MFESLRTRLKEMLRNNAKGYILIVCIFFAGVVLSFALNISVASREEMKLYINDFISNVKSFGVDSAKTFHLSLYGNIKSIVILFIMSLCVFGSYGIMVYIFLKGFSYGTFFSAIVGALGIKSAPVFLCVVLLHTIVSTPCWIIYSSLCIKNSHVLQYCVKTAGKGVLSTFFYAFLILAVLCVSALMQAYLEPVLIRASWL